MAAKTKVPGKELSMVFLEIWGKSGDTLLNSHTREPIGYTVH